MERIRSRYEGVWNVVRFNWHFYAIAVGFVGLLGVVDFFLPPLLQILNRLAMVGALATTLMSLWASHYIYDVSDLYRFHWLKALPIPTQARIVNIHAGFDETSILLQHNFPEARLQVFDFYNPAQHTEVSIQRARKAYPPFPHTQTVETNHLPLGDAEIDIFFVILSAHEIRQDAERVIFFNELKRVLKPDGCIVVIEHLRDMPNFLAYNIGFMHFLPRKAWLQTFQSATLRIANTFTITPFINIFVLQKNGTAS